MTDTTRLDELIALWRERGLSTGEAAEFITLAIDRIEGPQARLTEVLEEAIGLSKEEWGAFKDTYERLEINGKPTEPDVPCAMECENVYSDRTCPIGWTPPIDLEHLEILAERREDLLREMLESMARIEEALIVKTPCEHEWVPTTGDRTRCQKCGIYHHALCKHELVETTEGKKCEKCGLLIIPPCDHEWVTVVSFSGAPLRTFCHLCGKQLLLT